MGTMVPLPATAGHPVSAVAVSADRVAALCDGTVYLGSNDRKLHAVSYDGKLRFSVVAQGGITSSPAQGPQLVDGRDEARP